MKKTLLATTLLVAIAASTTASHAFCWQNLNPANWGTCPKCEKVCKKDNCDPCKPKCKCKKQKCDPCKKNTCDPCKAKCDPCEQKAQCDPCQKTVAPCDNCQPMPQCDACDKLQEATEK